MGRRGHKKLHQRQGNQDINGNTREYKNKNTKNGYTHQNGIKDTVKGKGRREKQKEASHTVRNFILCVGTLLVCVISFALNTQLNSWSQILFRETDVNITDVQDDQIKNTHEDFNDSKLLDLDKYNSSKPGTIDSDKVNLHADQDLTKEVRSSKPSNHNSNNKLQTVSMGDHSGKSLNGSQPQSAKIPGKVSKQFKDFEATIQNKLEPKEIVVEGRILKPKQLKHQKPNNSSVRLYTYEHFLSERECEGLIAAHATHMKQRENYQAVLCFDSLDTLKRHLVDVKKSHVVVKQDDLVPGTMCLNESFSRDLQRWMKSNWSYSTSFYPGESPFSYKFSNRIFSATGLKQEHGGKFQITSYPKGIGYKTHTDCLTGTGDLRDRFATILVYLKDVPEGGETQFPELGISVKPKAGTALIWNNMDQFGRCDPLSIHKANTVQNGHKYIIQRWYYYENFYALGKRIEEPKIPLRDELTPRVNCDQYENGSCRWYDEWSFEHIIEYTDIKHSLH